MTAAAATSSSSPALPQLRQARYDDYAQIAHLESSHGLLTLDAQDWRNIWQTNPVCRQTGDPWPIGWVLEDSAGAIVGSLANVPSLYTFGGRPLVAATGRAWVVRPEYRAIGLWLMDEYFSQPRADLFINTTVNALAVDAFCSFGSARVPLGDWQTARFWVTGYRGFARTALRLKRIPLPGLLSPAAGSVLWLKNAMTARPLPRGAASAAIEKTDTFDPRFDEFWRQLVRQSPDKLLCVRDSETLQWHFAGPLRAGHLRILTASANGLLRAWCILKRQDHPPSGLRRMRLVDFQTLEPDKDLLSPLIHAAIQQCKAEWQLRPGARRRRPAKDAQLRSARPLAAKAGGLAVLLQGV